MAVLSNYPGSVKCPVRYGFPPAFAIAAVVLWLFSPAGASQNSGSSASSSGRAAGGSVAGFSSASHVAAGSSIPYSGATHSHPPYTGNRGGNKLPGPRPPYGSGNGIVYYPFWYVLPVPYAVDAPDAAAPDDPDADAEYQGGPTVFDRRGSGADSYVPPVENAPPAHAPADDGEAAAQADSGGNSEPAAPPTVLVFKDGHQLEVQNYAVVSQTLYDLTAGHPRKIALADLDLPATQELNEDRGITFQLPSSVQAN